MKREAIKKVVRHAVERNIITLKGFSIPEEERLEEIVTVIQEELIKENSKAIEQLQNDFSDFIVSIKDTMITDDFTGEPRNLMLSEAISMIQDEYLRTQELIDEILSE